MKGATVDQASDALSGDDLHRAHGVLWRCARAAARRRTGEGQFVDSARAKGNDLLALLQEDTKHGGTNRRPDENEVGRERHISKGRMALSRGTRWRVATLRAARDLALSMMGLARIEEARTAAQQRVEILTKAGSVLTASCEPSRADTDRVAGAGLAATVS